MGDGLFTTYYDNNNDDAKITEFKHKTWLKRILKIVRDYLDVISSRRQVIIFYELLVDLIIKQEWHTQNLSKDIQYLFNQNNRIYTL